MYRGKGFALKKSTAIISIAIASALALGSLTYHHRGFLKDILTSQKDARKEMEEVAVEAQEVVVRPFSKELTAVGNLVANDSVIVRPQIDGIISNILFDSGADVAKGQTLYTLDDSLTQAQLADAQAELLLSSKNYERAKALAQQKFISQKDTDELFAKLEKAKAQVDLAKVRLSQTVLQSPFSGRAGIIQQSRGAYVNAGEDLVTIVALDPMKVDFYIGEEYLQSLKEGQEFTLVVDGFPQTFTGEIEAIEPKIDPVGHSILVRGRFHAHEANLSPGLFATLTLKLSSVEDAILIPESALETQGDSQFVYRVVDGLAVQTPVTVGDFENGMVHILDGLWSSDTVVTAGAMKISDGVPIRIVKGPEALQNTSLSQQQIDNAKSILRGELSTLSSKENQDVEKEVEAGESALESDETQQEESSQESPDSTSSLKESEGQASGAGA